MVLLKEVKEVKSTYTDKVHNAQTENYYRLLTATLEN